MHWFPVIYEMWSYKSEQLSRPVLLWGVPEEWSKGLIVKVNGEI